MTERIEAWLRARDASRFQSDMDKSAKSVEKVGKAADKGSLGMRVFRRAGQSALSILSSIGVAARRAGIGLGVMGVAAVGMGLKFNATMEQNEVSFTHFLGSTKEARKELDVLYNIAATTPFEFSQVSSAAKQLMAFGMTAKETNSNLRTLADAASGLGTGSEGINRMVIALGQMKVAGVVQGDELRQFQEAGINVYKYMEKAGLITKEDIGQIGQLHIDSAKAIDAIMKGMQKDFGGLSAEQAKTWTGQLSTMKDFAAQAAGALTKPLFDLLKGNVFPRINAQLEKVAKWARGGGVERGAGAIAAGFTEGLGPATEGYTGFDRVLVQIGDHARTGFNILKKGYEEVKPVAIDLWEIAGKLWDTIKEAKKIAPFIGVTLVGAFEALKLVIGFVNNNFDTLKTILLPLIVAFGTYKTTMLVLQGALKVAAIAQGALNAVMLLNPVGLVIAGIAALAVGFVVAYKKVDWFRNLVDSVWAFIKGHWKMLALLPVVGPLIGAVGLIVTNFTKIKNTAIDIVKWTINAFKNMISFIKGLPGKVANAATGLWDGLKSGLTSALNWVIDKVNFLIRKFNDTVGAIPGVPNIGEIEQIATETFTRDANALGNVQGDFGPSAPIGGRQYPGAAGGGDLLPGVNIVGETGPEIAIKDAGRVRIVPIKPGVTPIDRERAGALLSGGKRTIVVPVTINGREVARAVAEDTDDRLARR